MKTTKWIGCALILASGVTLAGPKPESASKALLRGAKQLRKLKSYEVGFSVTGGLAKGADHALIEQRVNENYTAVVRGSVVQINQGEGFRLRRNDLDGAIKQDVHWKALLATDKGRMIARLFKDPEATLGMALRSKKNAQWLEVSDSGEDPAAAPAAEAEEGSGTRNRRSGSGSTQDTGPLPTVLLVEGPAIEAIRHFEQIVSSGCFSEG